MGNGAEKRLNTYLFLWNVPGRFLAYMLPRYICLFTGLVALVAPQYQRESPTQTRASAAKVISFLSSPLDETGEKLQEAQKKQTLAQTLEIATDRPKSFLHLI